MTQVSNAGVFGALIGLIVGVLEYFLALMVIQKIVGREIADAEEAREELPGLASLGAMVQKVKMVLIFIAVFVYPLIGYAVAALLSADGVGSEAARG